MKVLVTGGAGFIGSHVVQNLIKSGHDPVVADNLCTGSLEFVEKDVPFYKVDITSPQIETVFAKERPDAVIHLAAQVDVAYSIQDPAGDARQNILGTIQLLANSQRFDVKKFIFSSSCAVYGKQDDVSIEETFPVQPLSYYGISKYSSEMYIKAFNSLHQLPYTILRYANVYGPRQSTKGEGGVISIFAQKVLQGIPPFIYGDGEQTRDFVFVKDVAEANVLSLNSGTNETFNIGCNIKTSINELFQSISKLTSKNIQPIFSQARSGDILHSCLNNSKAKSLLGWEPKYDLHSGLTETLNYYLNTNEKGSFGA
ncbi:NAD-dependent epimerase/dehydratase family protein [Neobacillus citreus]|uniref:NAD-dependent epimerase/dehydratase family protein n=1 Tax=Neobacillus citreus TaxID=2833578 RepID=A0A942SU40_9BACI|nr:NAD-dependent epimerase/dehydratase family protein [Neobacillus citreus]MCH6264778.1 NAD-dependent epimerase/dehydratase family protein [Neobacillus citreus]